MKSTESHIDYQVTPEDHGKRVDVVVAQAFQDYSRNQLTSMIKDKLILLNKLEVKPKDKVKAGDIISFLMALEALKPSEIILPYELPIEVLYEDNDLLIINKSADWVVHPGAGNPSKTLANALAYHYPDNQNLPRCGLVHRLDKDTTGVMVIAKNNGTYLSLVDMMQKRLIKRQYLALVQGYVPTSGSVSTHYGRDPRQRTKMAVTLGGKMAVTHYSVKRHFGEVTLLNLLLETGRTHQIRVHMAHIGYPIVGDKLYGKSIKLKASSNPITLDLLKNFSRQALHAQRLSFLHPISQEPLTISAPLPEDLSVLLKQLENDYEHYHT